VSSKNIQIFLILTAVLLLMIGCDSPSTTKERPKDEGDLYATVEISAGNIFPEFDKRSIPTFFNIAKVNKSNAETVSSILLGPKHSKGKKLAIKPVALLKFDNDTIPYKFVVCYPNKDSDADKSQFFVNNLHLQNSLEEWFKAQGEFNEIRNFKWENAYKAFLELD